MREKSHWKWVCAGCYVTSVLAPAGWVYFMLHTRNTFRLDEFTAGNLAVCLVLSLLPSVLFFLSWWLQSRHRERIWGGLLACFLFLLAAAGWIFTIAGQWGLWRAAYGGGLPRGQWVYLCVAAVVGAVAALLPLLSQLPEVFQKD